MTQWLSQCGRADLRCGDSLQVMPTLAADSVDALVTDPPYGLSFMGKDWDRGVPGEHFWREAIRVAKPGAHLLAFGGTRTFHRLACAIEDAGWEIRDCVMWVYGSGFPKSLDVSKAIDKRGGNVAGFAEFRDAVKAAMQRNSVTRQRLQDALGNFMLSHYLTAGSQPAVPVLRDYRIIRDTVGLGHKFDELFKEEADRDIIGQKRTGDPVAWYAESERGDGIVPITAPSTDAARKWSGWGTALKPAWEPIIIARKPCDGTVAANVMKYGTGAINVDGCRVGTEGGCKYEGGTGFDAGTINALGGHLNCVRSPAAVGLGRWPANLIHDGSDEVVRLFPDDGEASAARFFYCSKADGEDREHGNTHATVKPNDLMRYLCKLVTPKDAIILDPFMGSGSTGVAAIQMNNRFIGIELGADHFEICKRRVAAAFDTYPLLNGGHA